MIPRKQLDIGWSDLLFGIGCCFWPGNRQQAERRICEFWSSEADTVVSLAERGGFDLTLDVLDIPPGSEVLVSPLNIRSMFEVLDRHGLIAVPIELDMTTLEMKPEVLDRAVTSKTRAILFAQLFGSRVPMDSLVEFARRHELILFEDCAQAFCGDGYRGHADSDVVMVSFGPIKTCSTIMGGILRFKDTELAANVRKLQSQLPLHNRWHYLDWLVRFMSIKTFLTRPVFTLFMQCRKLLSRPDGALNNWIRVFGGADEVARYRKQPSYPLLALLDYRLKRFDPKSVEQRRYAGETVVKHMPFLRRPAENAPHHTYWTFPVEVHSPTALMKHLRTLGFDSIDSYASFIIPDRPPTHLEFGTPETRKMMENVLYLPVHNRMSDDELIQLAKAVTEFESAQREAADAVAVANASQEADARHKSEV